MKKLFFIISILLLASCSGTKTVSVRTEYIDDIYYNPYYYPHYNHFYDYSWGYPIIYNSYPEFTIYSPKSIYTRPGSMYKYNQRDQIRKYRSSEEYKKQHQPKKTDNKQRLNINRTDHRSNYQFYNDVTPNENRKINDIKFNSTPQQNIRPYSTPQQNSSVGSGRSTISNSGRR